MKGKLGVRTKAMEIRLYFVFFSFDNEVLKSSIFVVEEKSILNYE